MTAPLPSSPRAYHFPAFEHVALPGGARLLIAPVPKLPLVTLTAVFGSAGAAEEPPDRAGIAQLTAGMLLEGTKSLDGGALAERFESLGSSLSIGADWDCGTASFTVQPAKLLAATELLREVVLSPAFRESDLARLKGDHESERMQLVADARALGDSAFAWSCYEADGSRFRRPIDGTLSTVANLTASDLESFWQRCGTTQNLTLILAGDVTPALATHVAQTLLNGWPTAAAIQASRDERGATTSRPHLTLVERPEAAQTELRIGHVGVPRSHPNYYELTVMNAVLGGLFSSRINLNLRERHGYTYGAFSSFDWRVRPGPWVVSTAVKSEVSGAAITEILTEIDRIRSEPISQDELELATKYLVGVFPLRFETTAAVASALASLSVYGLPGDYFDTYRDRIAAVTTHHVLTVAREHLNPGALHIVAVGEPAVLGAQLRARGEIRTLSPAEVEAAK